MSRPHVLTIPLPAQGHVIPLLELSRTLVKHGFRVTFVNTEHTHKLLINALPEKTYTGDDHEIHLVFIPDGMESLEDRKDIVKLCESVSKVMPGKLEELIQNINRVEDEKITCVIVDGHAGQLLKVAEKLKIKRAAFLPSAAASLALYYHIPKLIDDGIINYDGTPTGDQMIQLGPDMPTISSAKLIWNAFDSLASQKALFETVSENTEAVKLTNCVICNSTYELEPEAFTLVPNIHPIGPLLTSKDQENSAGYFWQEDSTCLKWLDQQQPQSVIYVAFGSHTVINPIQLQELALGLELTNRPFLWVLRPDMTNDVNEAYGERFQNRVANRGKMVGWAPQQKVLNHPSIACFMSHCGWNSTMEGLSNGVPFLCWPCFADQFLNESYICDSWKVGLRFNRVKSGIILREEVKNKVDQLLGDKNFKDRALQLKAAVMNSVREGGQSNETLKNFIEWIKL